MTSWIFLLTLTSGLSLIASVLFLPSAMMRPSPVQSASHSAEIPVNIVMDASVAVQSPLPSPRSSAMKNTTLVVPISRSTGLLGNPPVFPLLVTSCWTNQSRRSDGCRAISEGGDGNYYGGVLLFCRCFFQRDPLPTQFILYFYAFWNNLGCGRCIRLTTMPDVKINRID